MISVGAVDGDALVAVVGALVDGLRVVSALVVLEAKRGLVSLGHFHSKRIDDVEMGKHFHRVVMPKTYTHKTKFSKFHQKSDTKGTENLLGSSSVSNRVEYIDRSIVLDVVDR